MLRNVTYRIGKIMLLLLIFLFSFISLKAQNAFITTWKTDNVGISDSTSITVPVDSSISYNYNYDVDWDNDGVFDELGITGSVTHNFENVGIYTIRIKGDFPKIYFKEGGDKTKILDVLQWGDIEWKSMYGAFQGCENLNISATDAPDLSNVTSLRAVFFGCTSMNANIEYWDVSNVSNFYFAFGNCSQFNQPLDNWDMSSATSLQRMFIGCSSFNQLLNSWDVSSVTSFGAMFSNCSIFNQPLNNWDVSNGIHFGLMFSSASSFNQNIGNWNVSNAISLKAMFHKATVFNQDIGGWNTNKVTTLENTFKGAKAFNQNIGNWDVSNVTNMVWIFAGATDFDQDIGSWDVSQVTKMNYVFFHATDFNQDIGNWNTGNVVTMANMFKGTQNFNQDIGNWDVSKVTTMASMFESCAAFDQNLGNWDVSQVTTLERFFNLSTMSTSNYDSLLISWNYLTLQDSINFHGGYSIYCKGWAARANMIAADSWTIEDGGSENIPPVVFCKDIIIYLDETGTANITADMLNDDSYDICTEVSFSASQTIFDCSDIGTQFITLIVSGANGNTDSCVASVSVFDTPFSYTCPPDITVAANRSECLAQVDWEEPQANCNISFTSNYKSEDLFPVGTTEVIYIITDSFSISDTCSFNITVVNNVVIELDNIIHPNCIAEEGGQVFINPKGGISPFSFDWDIDGVGDFDDEKNQSDLEVGKYHLTVMDSLGCIVKDSIELIFYELNITDSLQNLSCYDSQDGKIFISTSEGLAPYSINWSHDNLEDNFALENLHATNYSFSVTDKNGCIRENSVEIYQPSSLELSATINTSSTPPTNEIDLTVIGGTPPYLFDWSVDGIGDYDDEEDATTLLGDTFTVIVKDANGCIAYLDVVTETQEVTCVEGNFNIYPNPNNGEFFMEFETCKESAKVEIFDILGRKIHKEFTTETINSFELKILPSGIYFIKINRDGGALIKSFEVVKK